MTAEEIAEAAGADLIRSAPGEPERVIIDSREARPGDLFVGLVGEHSDGSEFAQAAIDAGAWGVLKGVGSPHPTAGAVLESPAVLASLQALAQAWRRRLGAQVIYTEDAGQFSSAAKGEILEDTTRVVAGYRPKALVLRHHDEDAPVVVDRNMERLGFRVPVFNAGSGAGHLRGVRRWSRE